MKVLTRPSPNFNERPNGISPDMIVIHYTGMESAEAAIKRLCNPNPEQAGGRVSAHYTIDENGDVYQHVDPQERAWHAGISAWRGRENLNDYSIGIEIVNKGHEIEYQDFTKAQIEALMSLMHVLRSKFDIPLSLIVGHQDIAPTRKQDPGYKFPWHVLAAEGLALMPKDQGKTALKDERAQKKAGHHEAMNEPQWRELLAQIGYKTSDDVPLNMLTRAFHARFMGHEKQAFNADSVATAKICAKMFSQNP